MTRFAVAALILTVLPMGAGPVHAEPASASRRRVDPVDPVDLVDPFVGTKGDHGQLAPAATGPYAMVQLAPQTVPAQHPGYDFAADHLVGFTHTRAVGVGCGGGGGNLMVSLGYAGESGPFAMDKTSERAAPGWYHVAYDGGIRADLAANGAAGIAHFTLPRAGVARVVIDPRSGATRVRAVSWARTTARDMAGRLSAGTVCEQGAFHLSFASRLRHNGRAVPLTATRLSGDRLEFAITVAAGDTIDLGTGLSVVDPASARRVRDRETGKRGYADLRRMAEAAWSRELGRFAVPGRGETARLFYTSLFRAMQVPVRIDDEEGRYRRSDGSLHRVARGHHRYAGWAVWDNYRTQLPLLALADPARARDVSASLAELYLAGKARWATPNEPFITVRTEHAGVALLDFARKGIGGFDRARILPLMIAELPQLPHTAPDEQIETAYDTWAVAQMAADLGQADTARRYTAAALSYRTMWQRVFAEVSPDFDTVKARGLYQGTLWQYRWAPVFDLDWLIETGLGRARFNAELARFFDEGLYNMTNQPDIQAPWLFALSGAPQRTQALVHRYLSQDVDHWYTNAGKRAEPWHGRSFALDPVGFADGMDDDEGGMSSWYVWGALGLYPLVPGKPFYAVTAPAFGHASLDLGGGRKLVIERVGPAGGSMDHIAWNGTRLAGFTIDHARLVKGGTLRVVLR
ncbi:glycoside hydrolase family 92 protein [Novosphingobium sp. 1949]|uniref:Glycoside hydrolase family 92 protein n=1 Tax=Novosphingobium organovorum TaxID=2930092 RepID=A0ABT0BIN1_9SPHN|nr:glycoside hydrolase domain-containing protein [Novosphingobium organovorum]MCJ2184681.1 glycoside hydrolase family 92 protein [Novosphingobium organovorum]